MAAIKVKLLSALGLCVSALSGHSASAAQALSETEMADISGRDGISVDVTLPTINMSDFVWKLDQGVTAVGGVVISPDTNGIAQGLSIKPVNPDGTLPGGTRMLRADLDVGSPAGPSLSLRSSWDRVRLEIGAYGNEPVLSGGALARSVGTMAFDSGGGTYTPATRTYSNGSLSFIRRFGAPVASNTDFSLNIVDASLYFRQGAVGTPELLLDNIFFNPNFTNGTLGIDPSGLLVSAANLNFNLTFDLRYDSTPAASFTYGATDRPMLYYGWNGTLTNFEARVKPGGVWYGTTGAPAVENTANRSEGLNFSARWDYLPSFAWVVGESNTSGTGNPRIQIRFDTWQKIGTGFAFDTPNNTLDIVKAGQGPGGLCWGTNASIAGPAGTCGGASSAPYYSTPQYIDVAAEDGVVLLARDAKQMAYSTRVVILDDFNNDGLYTGTAAVGNPNIAAGTLETQNVQWGLIYTLGDFDANIFFYPGGYDFGTNTATATGLKTDFVIMTQSHDGADADLEPDFVTGSHYMIADTGGATHYGIGFMNSGILLAAQDLYVTMATAGLNFRTHPTTGRARVGFKGRFGGGDLPSMTKPVKGFDINANFEATAFDFTLLPPVVGQNYLGFSGSVDLADLDDANFAESTAADTTANELNDDDGTFISLAEPGRPLVDFRLARISGRLAWSNGLLDMVSDSESATFKAGLVLGNTISIGATAGGAPLTVGRVEFGDRSLGTIVIPSGIINASIGLQRQ
jgi:hypothetical protein